MTGDRKQLSAFLRVAHKNTYAADADKAGSSRLKSQDFEYREGDFLYHDTYFGSDSFIGEEVVYEKEIPIWGMNYYGYIASGAGEAKEIYAFLKAALLAQSLSEGDMAELPLRGPQTFVRGEFSYAAKVTGTLENFSGEETIEKTGRTVYEALFHGGSIIQKIS